MKALAVLPLFPGLVLSACSGAAQSLRRLRPGEGGWPDATEWEALSKKVGGRLMKVESPFAVCTNAPDSTACGDLFHNLRNPFFIGDDVALTETLGWIDAWTSEPSQYAVRAENSADVAAAINFARDHHLRLVIKGGSHSYLGASNAPDSLLVWTRAMRDVKLLDSFVPQGAQGRIDPEPAVSVGAGAIWLDAYEAVTTRAGRYVQGGGCVTVGVAGLVQGGGFGSFSKGFGTAAANLLEAEVVTADGTVRVANAVSNPDLFWALKGGGGGTFGVVTRLTLRTHTLPNYLGPVSATITATSDVAYRALVHQLMSFYRTSLMNPHWGEQITFGLGRQIDINMAFQGLDQTQAEQTWAPFFDWVTAQPTDYTLSKPTVIALPAKDYWNPAVLRLAPGAIVFDDRPGAPKGNFFFAGDAEQVGWVLYAFQSTWLPQQLLEPERQPTLVNALVQASRNWPVTLHCNKGLAGATANALSWTKDTSMNPAVLDAFALVIAGASQPPAYPGIPGHQPDVPLGKAEAKLLNAAMAPLKALSGQPASYVNETDYFQADWQTSFWGSNYTRLQKIKDHYDPDGLFFVHHGVGSEAWSADGFTKLG